MKVLILGAKGMLGQELVRVFSDHNAPQPPLILRGGEGELLAWDREELDITNVDEVVRRIAEVRPTLIINAAAYNAVDKAEEEPEVANRVNGDAVSYLAKAAADCSATFVHYSSDYVFDGTKKEGYREDDTPNPISAYGKSKLLGEQYCTRMPLVYKEHPCFYLIRTSRLFGSEGGGKRSFVDTMLDRARKREDGPLGPRGPSSPYLELVDEEVASPTYAADLAERTRGIIDEQRPSGIYHITNNGACTWYTFAQEIFKHAVELGFIKKIPELIPVPASRFLRPAKRPAFSQLVNTKLPPPRPWQEALRDYLHTPRS